MAPITPASARAAVLARDPAPDAPWAVEPPVRRAADDGAGRPVALDVDPTHEDGLRRWVEGVLGWQVVDHLTAGLVPPTVHLVGPNSPPPGDTIPRVLVVDERADAPAVVTACQRLRPAAGVAWPRERDQLQAVVDEVVAVPGEPRADRQVLRVGGVAGGVGTTTVVLALAGLGGWQGRPTLAAVRGDVPAGDLPVVSSEALAATDLWSRLGPLDGVPSARAVRIGDPGPLADPRDPTVELAVLDHGVDSDVDIVVCRMDAAALEGLPATTAAVIVVVGAGPLGPKALRQATGGRRTLLLPLSTRVARAGLHRRVPGSLPGAWLRRLLPLLPPLPQAGDAGSDRRRGPPPSRTGTSIVTSAPTSSVSADTTDRDTARPGGSAGRSTDGVRRQIR